MAFGRSDSSAATINGLVYIAGGCDGAQDCNSGSCYCSSVTVDFSVYNPASDAWATLPPLPTPRYRHSSCVWRDSIFLFGGRSLSDDIITAIDVYNTTSALWSTLGTTYPVDSGVESTKLGSDNTCVTLNDAIYVMGGYTPTYNVSLNSTFAFSPLTSTWARRKGALHTGRGDFTGAALGGLIYVFGGYNAGNFCAPLATTEVYSPTADAWSPGLSLPAAGAEKDDGVVIDGGLLAIGGETKTDPVTCVDPDIVPLRSVYWYAPGETSAGWVPEASLPDGRMRFSAAAVGGVVYVFGGQARPIDGGYEIPLLYTVLAYGSSPSSSDAGSTYYGYTPGQLGGALVGMFIGTVLLVALVVAAVVCARKRRREQETRGAGGGGAAAEKSGILPAAEAAPTGAGGPRLSEIVVTPDVVAAAH